MTRYRRAPRALWRRTLGAVVVLPPGRDDPLVLEETAAAIWEQLDVERSARELALLLVPGQEPTALVLDDIAAFLAELSAADAVVDS